MVGDNVDLITNQLILPLMKSFEYSDGLLLVGGVMALDLPKFGLVRFGGIFCRT
jgi:hypothetical protein